MGDSCPPSDAEDVACDARVDPLFGIPIPSSDPPNPQAVAALHAHLAAACTSADALTDPVAPLPDSLRDCVARVIELALDTLTGDDDELMVHTHADNRWATISLVNAGAGERVHPAQHLAESILQRDLVDLGGRISLRDAGDHRCVVVSLPLGTDGEATSLRAARPRLERVGGAA